LGVDGTQEILNNLLASWHRWASAAHASAGFYTTNAACKLYRCSRQYDSHNGASDTDHESERMEAVGYCIDRMEQPWRTAVEFNARNLATGVVVWQSPRLPTNDIERAYVLIAARRMLSNLLERDGII
jgi:hypothetical protein